MSSDLILYHIAPSRSSIVHWMLEEVGEPYDLRVLDMEKGENRQPDFLKINPMGKVPTLVHDGVVITEAAAICAYLADAYPRAGLSVPIGDRRRGPYLKWLFFGPGALEPALVDVMLKREAGPVPALGYGSLDMVVDVLAQAVEPGPYLLGPQFTAADVVLGATIHWGSSTGALSQHPALTAYASRIAERPAFQRAWKRDEEIAAARQTG